MNSRIKKILILSVGPVPTAVTSKVEGGGLRAWGLAQGLNKNGISVTVAMPDNFDLEISQTNDGISLRKWSFNNLNELFVGHDAVYVLYSRGDLMKFVAENLPKEKLLIVDLYVPIYIESLARELKRTPEELSQYLFDLKHWNTAFPRGDFFICANETQYHFYNGVLSALGRINPVTYNHNILDILPYGIHSKELIHNKSVCKNVLIKDTDFMILWFGGLYPWFDIKPLLLSVKDLSIKNSDVKLVILGGRNPFVTDKKFMQQYDFALDFAKKEDLFEKNIFFIDWIAYEERNNWYMESDLVVNLHHKSKETIYSWRTRIIDYIWGELPILTTGGDEASEYLAKKDCAIILKSNTVEDISAKIGTLYENRDVLKRMKHNIANIKPDFYWENITKNLAAFIKKGAISPDRDMLDKQKLHLKKIKRKDESIPYLISLSVKILFKRGPKEFLRKIHGYILK